MTAPHRIIACMFVTLCLGSIVLQCYLAGHEGAYYRREAARQQQLERTDWLTTIVIARAK